MGRDLDDGRLAGWLGTVVVVHEPRLAATSSSAASGRRRRSPYPSSAAAIARGEPVCAGELLTRIRETKETLTCRASAGWPASTTIDPSPQRSAYSGVYMTISRSSIALCVLINAPCPVRAEPYAAPSIRIAPDSVDFGETPAMVPKRRELRLLNEGSFAIDVGACNTSGPFLLVDSPLGYPLLASGNLVLTVEMRTRGLGVQQGTIECNAAISETALQAERQAAADEAKPRLERLGRVIERLRLAGPDFSPVVTLEHATTAEWAVNRPKLESMVTLVHTRLVALFAEKHRALDELRSGRYCSKCHRPASQIEAEEHVSFAEHLQNVGAAGVPASQAEIDAKADEYDKKIQAIATEVNQAKQAVSVGEATYTSRMTELDGKRRALQELHLKQLADLGATRAEVRAQLGRKLAELSGRQPTSGALATLVGIGTK